MAFKVAVDYLIFSHPLLPGLPGITAPADKTTLSAPKLKRNWDVKPGFGIEGSFCTYTGEGLAMFDVTFEFWSEEKEPFWAQWAATFLSSPAGKPFVIGIYHPVLVTPPFAIRNVVATDIEGWSLVTPGKWQTRVSFLQHKPAKPFKPVKTTPVTDRQDQRGRAAERE